jgi:hypothetical protein
MKKIALFVALLVALVLLLPILGNRVADSALNEKIEILKSNGIEVLISSSDFSYLYTKKHYEFLLSDAEKFIEYLNTFSNGQLPSYTHMILDGVLIGADLEYSNFPLAKAISVDIYPLKLSNGAMSDIQEMDAAFYTYIKTFLENRGLLYHLNYNIATTDFKGYIKDIKEEHTLQNGSHLSIKLFNTLYHGRGDLITPNEFVSSAEKIMLKVSDSKEKFIFNLENLSTSSTFESKTAYLSNVNVEKLEMLLQGSQSDTSELNASEINFNVSSSSQGNSVDFESKSSMNTLHIQSNNLNIKASNLNYDVALHGIDKDSLEKLRTLLSQLKSESSLQLQTDIEESVIALLSKGMRLDINDLSLQKIIIDKTNDLEGFSVQSSILLKEDANLKQKIEDTPAMIAQLLNIDIKLKFSKLIFDAISEELPMSVLAQGYAKDDGKNMMFDISYVDGTLKVNNKVIQY